MAKMTQWSGTADVSCLFNVGKHSSYNTKAWALSYVLISNSFTSSSCQHLIYRWTFKALITYHAAHSSYWSRTNPDHRNNWTRRREMANHGAEVVAIFVLGVVLDQLVQRGCHDLESRESKPSSFEARNDFSNKSSEDAFRFDHHKSSLFAWSLTDAHRPNFEQHWPLNIDKTQIISLSLLTKKQNLLLAE